MCFPGTASFEPHTVPPEERLLLSGGQRGPARWGDLLKVTGIEPRSSHSRATTLPAPKTVHHRIEDRRNANECFQEMFFSWTSILLLEYSSLYSGLTCILVLIFFFFHFICKAEKVKETEIEISHLLVYSPNAHSSQSWARLQLGARSSVRVSCVRGRDPSPCANIWCSPRFCISRKLYIPGWRVFL